jgi:hypothetical protein
VVRRVLPPNEFATWLTAFLPRLPTTDSGAWLPIGVVTDMTDGKLAHLDGLNLSRAWMLEGIAAGLPSGDLRRRALIAAAQTHAGSGLAAVPGNGLCRSIPKGSIEEFRREGPCLERTECPE